jgi:dihydroxyacetone kinase phosphoprotein-dependent L subunit
MMLDADMMRRWIRNSAASVRENRDYLTQLDAAIGDADHGANMDRGFSAAMDRFDDFSGLGPGELLTTLGSTLVSAVGGASGALWGTAFLYGGRALGDVDELDCAALATALEQALAGVVEIGAAREGEKTMVDALGPASRALRAKATDGASVADALAATRAAGEEGMLATVEMQATKGRASYLGERSIGHQDPGATSTVIILRALEQAALGNTK